MQVVKIECPACGATPEMNPDMEFGFCMYCGAKIYIPNAIQKIKGTVSIDRTNEIDNLLKRADSYENAGDYTKADEYYERILDIDAENDAANNKRPILHVKMAVAYEQQGNFVTAEQILQKAAKLFPESDVVCAELQRVLNTIYVPNVTIVNATKKKETVYELFGNGLKRKVVDLQKDNNDRIQLKFMIGAHTISAGKARFDFYIGSNKEKLDLVLESKGFGSAFRVVENKAGAGTDPNRLSCPQCGSNNISVQIVETGTETTKKGIGVKGHVNNVARGVTALSTLGMSNIVWKKSKPQEQQKIINAKVCICQQCGYSWEKY